MAQSYRKVSAKRRFAHTIGVVLLLAGCDLDRRPYTVDGTVHATYTVTSMGTPHLFAHEGAIYVRAEGYADYPVPHGWIAEIKPMAEVER